MPIHKRKRNGKTSWFYKFDAPGSTRTARTIHRGFGFETKQAAVEAEATRRIDEQKKVEMEKAGAGVTAEVPRTLAMLLDEFFKQHADERLAAKTVERYRQQVTYLSSELLAMPLADITPLHLNREWSRLVKSGGHTRMRRGKESQTRPMSAKTVRSIAGVVSSAFGRAIRWGLVSRNPVTGSEPPIPKKHQGVALTVAQQDSLIAAAGSPWWLAVFIEIAAALGARRGEVLALRWSDIGDGRVAIARSLTQTKKGLAFKLTKTERPRVVSLPPSALRSLTTQRKRQAEFREQFGPSYRTDLDLVFANPDGTPLRPDSVSATVSLLMRKLKFPRGTSLHSLRHTHGSHMLANGVPLPVVSERLGHSSIRVTADVYSHAIRGQDDDAARRWEEFQQRNREAPRAPKGGRVQ